VQGFSSCPSRQIGSVRLARNLHQLWQQIKTERREARGETQTRPRARTKMGCWQSPGRSPKRMASKKLRLESKCSKVREKHIACRKAISEASKQWHVHTKTPPSRPPVPIPPVARWFRQSIPSVQGSSSKRPDSATSCPSAVSALNTGGGHRAPAVFEEPEPC